MIKWPWPTTPKKTPKIKIKTYKGEKTKTKNLTSEREIKQNAVT